MRVVPAARPELKLLDLRLDVSCDGCVSLMPAGATVFGPDYMVLRRELGALGWRRTTNGTWLGPCCKGKAAESDD